VAYEQLKERIKESPVSLVISNFISLNKKGSNLEALCPFHPDTKPSLKVNDSKGMYKCFVCGAGGDAITFVMNFKRLEFVEALKEISSILGLPFEDQKEKKKNPKIEMAFRVLNASVKLYKKVAAQKPNPYVEFLDKRKLTEETVERWQIGYAPGNNALFHYLDSLPGADGNTARSVAKEIGIIRYNENRDSHYDFYRDRVMFPIHDHSGQIRGYSSRAVLPDQNPKYLNSGESFAFDKGSILFGFYFGKNAIRQNDQVIIVEGNMDVIMMHQFGFLQTVGTMGTALSDQSVRLLSNMTKNIFLGMDSDAAGKKAMHRINNDFLSIGVLPKYITFDPHKDPDEFLVNEGRLALIERQEKAPIYLDVLIQEIYPEKIPENTDLKLATLHKAFELVAPLKEHLAATERIINAAKSLGLRSDPATILESYKEFLSHQKEKIHHREERPKLEEIEEKLEQSLEEARNLQELTSSSVPLPLSKSERLVLKEILCHPEFLTHLKVDEFLATIGHPEVKKLIHWLVKIYLEIDDAEYVSIVQDQVQYGGYTKEVIEVGTEALFNYGNKYNEKVIGRMLKDYQLMLKMDQLKVRRKDLVEKQKSSPTQQEVDLILSEISKLDKEILSLKNTVP
jgi:DNA primase